MRISIIVDDFHGGAGNIAQILSMELAKENEVSLVLTNKHTEKRYDLSDVSVHELCLNINGKNKIGRLISSIIRLKKLLFDILHTEFCISFLDNNNSMACLALWNHKEIPIIVSERSNPLVIYPKFPWDRIRRIAYKRADRVAVQFDVFREFDGGRFRNKCVTIPNIVENAKEQKSTWESKVIRFVTVARLSDIKRIDLMVILFKRCLMKVKNIELYIYGEGDNRAALEKAIRQSGLENKVFLMGYLKNVHETICNCDIYLMTSYQEGFPNSLSEAMAVGLPSISFCCHEGLRELIENNECGYLIAEGDEDGFVDKMEFLATHRETREHMGKAARKHVNQYNTSSVMEYWKTNIEEVRNEKNNSFYR